MGMAKFFDIISRRVVKKEPVSVAIELDKPDEIQKMDSVSDEIVFEAGPDVIGLNAVKDLWYPIHSNQTISLSGKIKDIEQVAYEGQLLQSHHYYQACLYDETAKIHIKWWGMPFVWDSRNVYKVVGVCDTDDFIYSYLKNCTVTLSQPIHEQHWVVEGADSHGAATDISSVELIMEPMVVPKPDSTKSDDRVTGANWTRKVKGSGVSNDSSWHKLRLRAFKRDNYHCVQCGSNENLTVDHIQPLSLGGTNAMDNLQTLCADCHEDKHYTKFLDETFTGDNSYGESYRLSNKMRAVTDAIKSKKPIEITYTDRKQVTTTRTIWPSRIYKGYRYMGKTVCANCVYIDAYCELDKADRTFRLSRMRGIA